jgi:hypothetical protein
MSQDSTTTTWIERLQELSQSKQFLNKEFLTWLWYFAEQNQGPIEFTPKDLLDAPQTKKKSSFYLWIDDKIILESIHRGGQKTLQHSIKGGDPSKSPEAGLALLGGKIVKELKLGMRILPWGDFTATLNGTDLNPRSLTLPKPTDDTSQNQCRTAFCDGLRSPCFPLPRGSNAGQVRAGHCSPNHRLDAPQKSIPRQNFDNIQHSLIALWRMDDTDTDQKNPFPARSLADTIMATQNHPCG